MYLKLYVWQFHYLAFCTLMGDEVLVGFALSLESTHLCFLVPCGLPWAFILSHQTIVISLHWSPCLTSFPLLHAFLPMEEWVNFLQTNQMNSPAYNSWANPCLWNKPSLLFRCDRVQLSEWSVLLYVFQPLLPGIFFLTFQMPCQPSTDMCPWDTLSNLPHLTLHF